MPALQHYTLFDESIEILRSLMEENQLVAIPERPVLEQPELQRYVRFAPELVEALKEYRVVQLEGTFTKHPLQFERRASGTAVGTYYVADDIGPRIRWTLPAVVGESRRTVTPGSIGHLKSYRDPSGTEWKPASDELVLAFKDVLRTMKKHLVKATVSRGDTIWVGARTKKELDSGDLHIDR